MRKKIRRFLPDHAVVRDNRWLQPFARTLLHPRLWHLNRHSAAGAVAAGLFCGLIPGPLQMLGAAICCVLFRVNLPLALVTTLYTNPFTIVPLYVVAATLGGVFLGNGGDAFAPPPDCDWHHPADCMQALSAWMVALGKPLMVGLPLLATLLAIGGYLVVQVAWRWHLRRAWRRRAAARR